MILKRVKNALCIIEGIGTQGLYKKWKLLKFIDKIQLELTKLGHYYVK